VWKTQNIIKHEAIPMLARTKMHGLVPDPAFNFETVLVSPICARGTKSPKFERVQSS
jgi:hypothetical protein